MEFYLVLSSIAVAIFYEMYWKKQTTCQKCGFQFTRSITPQGVNDVNQELFQCTICENLTVA